MENINDTYLSDWMSEKISDDQLKQYVSAEDFCAYLELKKQLNSLEITNPNMEQNWFAIQQKIKSKKAKKYLLKSSKIKYIAVAASLVIAFTLYQLFVFTNIFETASGIKNSIVMNDGSTVILNANSSVSYPNWFSFQRKIKLNGEAFFEVKKGSTFEVLTDKGKIKVLGTKFNVKANKNYFEVNCYEGKVLVKVNDQSLVLTKDEIVRVFDNKVENWANTQTQKPLWISGVSTFKNTPMEQVIYEFENQYNIKVEFPKHLYKLQYTGSFSHHNINIALQSICVPLKLKYKFEKEKIIINE